MQHTSCVLCNCNSNSDGFQFSTILINKVFSSLWLEFLCDLLCVEHGHR
jgi:hypothetical protein